MSVRVLAPEWGRCDRGCLPDRRPENTCVPGFPVLHFIYLFPSDLYAVCLLFNGFRFSLRPSLSLCVRLLADTWQQTASEKMASRSRSRYLGTVRGRRYATPSITGPSSGAGKGLLSAGLHRRGLTDTCCQFLLSFP